MNTQREIKIKIWDKNDTKALIGPFEWNKIPNFQFPENFDIVQYTGLKDKNGVEIYEGDRVRFGYTKNEDFFGEVIWLEDRASFGVISKGSFETFEDLMDYMKLFEVVGNIFQLPCNPDHNGECLVCDCWLSDCQFLNKENKD
jgi:uncharacterized phage protein (TIGR01671 family)